MRKHLCRQAFALDAQVFTNFAANAWCCATFFAACAIAFNFLAICTATRTTFTFSMSYFKRTTIAVTTFVPFIPYGTDAFMASTVNQCIQEILATNTTFCLMVATFCTTCACVKIIRSGGAFYPITDQASFTCVCVFVIVIHRKAPYLLKICKINPSI
jgi:hypothetical protein